MLLLCLWWFAARYGKKNHIDYLWICDHLVIPVAFAGAFIRLGNLFNSEIYGDVTSLPWGFIFEQRGETEPKHPTQIYEALSYFLLGLLLLWLYWKKLDKMYRGSFLGIFMILCFGMRFLIEFIKEPQVEFEIDDARHGAMAQHPLRAFGIVLVYAWRKRFRPCCDSG